MHKIQNISHAGATTADILFFKCTIARHATQMSAFRYFLDRLKLIDIRCCLIPVLVHTGTSANRLCPINIYHIQIYDTVD